MRRAHRTRTTLGLGLLAAALLAIGPTLPAAATDSAPRTYPGGAYSAEHPVPPTQTENQNKIWFHADAWWALLLEPTGRGVRVFELMPDHTWRPTSAMLGVEVGDVGDALRDGDTVHVATRGADGALYYVRLTFDPASRDYRSDPPRLVTTRGTITPSAIGQDTTGRLWIAFATATEVLVAFSNDDGLTWERVRVLADTAGTPPEAVALAAYDDRMGVLWSDQASGSFRFASHFDRDDPDTWSYEDAWQGPGRPERQISLVRVDGDTGDSLVAAVQTSPEELGETGGAPQLEALVRSPGGRWSQTAVSTAGDGLRHAVLQVDEVTRTLHLFAARNNHVVEKTTPVDEIAFEPGPGRLFVHGAGGGLVNPTVGKEPGDARSGLVVLASDVQTRTYRHAEAPIVPPAPVADPADVDAPSPPDGLQAKALSPETVVLSWTEATDGDRWSPGREGVPAAQYVVLRDGVEIATLSSTSVQDRPRDGGDAATGDSVEYLVQAVDASGNRSEPARVVVDLPRPESSVPVPVRIGLLALAAGAAGWLVRRRLG